MRSRSASAFPTYSTRPRASLKRYTPGASGKEAACASSEARRSSRSTVRVSVQNERYAFAKQKGRLRGVKEAVVAPKRARRSVQSVDRALDLVEALAAADGEVSITALATRTGLHVSTVHRLLSTLLRRGYVRQNPETSRYYAGPKLAMLAEGRSRFGDMRMRARPILHAITESTRETANLVVLDDTAAVYIETVPSPQVVRLFTAVGNRVPLHATGAGKCLLAALPAAARDALIDRLELRPYTPHTIVDPAALRHASAASPSTTRSTTTACAASPCPSAGPATRSPRSRCRRPPAGSRGNAASSSSRCCAARRRSSPRRCATGTTPRHEPGRGPRSGEWGRAHRPRGTARTRARPGPRAASRHEQGARDARGSHPLRVRRRGGHRHAGRRRPPQRHRGRRRARALLPRALRADRPARRGDGPLRRRDRGGGRGRRVLRA